MPPSLSWIAVLAGIILALAGCAPYTTGSIYYDGRFWYSNVKTGSDIAGGPRHDIVTIVDSNGTIVETYATSGIGTLQTLASGVNALVTAGGQAAHGALVRPARNTTNVEMNVQGTGGAGGTGGTSTTSSSATGGALSTIPQ